MAADIYRVINLPVWSQNYYMKLLGEHEKGYEKFATLRGLQQLRIIAESGLYKLVMRSDKERAKESQNWIASEVLPVIRKDGMYVKGEEKIDPSDDAALDRLAERVIEGFRKKDERLENERDAAIADRIAVQPSKTE